MVGSARATYIHDPKPFVFWWFFLSNLLVIWDAGYVLSRPHSFEGGKWQFMWPGYHIYQATDYIYGLPAWDLNDGFTAAQTWLNIIETSLNYAYLYCWYRKGYRASALLGFTAAVMTFWKTALYWLQEALGGFQNIGHNEPFHLFYMWIIPNGAWLVFPTIIMWQFGVEIWEALGATTVVPEDLRRGTKLPGAVDVVDVVGEGKRLN